MNRTCVTLSLFLGTALVGSLTSLAAQELNAGTFADLTFREIGPINMSGRIVDIAVVESDVSLPLGGERGEELTGRWVLPGEYTIRLRVAETVREQTVVVSEDPRAQVSDRDRREWHETLVTLSRTIREQAAQLAAVNDAKDRLEGMSEPERSQARDIATEIDEILPLLTEVRRRLTQLYDRIDGWAGPPTADQRRQLAYLAEWVVRLQARVERVIGKELWLIKFPTPHSLLPPPRSIHPFAS